MTVEEVIPGKIYTLEEHLKLEENNDLRFEYDYGKVVFKNGSSFTHADICSNTNHALKSKLRSENCVSFQVSVKVEVEKGNVYFYPDVGLTRSTDDIADGYLIKHPLLIAEVLSPSTESYDRNEKWNRYRQMPSLKYFLFVSQQMPFVELYSSGPNSLYQYQAFDQMDDVIDFPELKFSLSLRQIYENIRFSKG